MRRPRAWFAPAFLAAGAVILRVIHLLQLRAHDPVFNRPVSDAAQYHQYAQDVLNNGLWGTAAFYHPPLYQYFLALQYRLFGVSLLAPRIIQLLLGVASVLFVYVLAQRLYHRTVAIIAAAVAACYPLLIYYETELLTPTLLIFLVLAGFVVLDRKRPGRLCWSGVLFGLAAITTQNILLFIVAFPVYLVITDRRAYKSALLFLAGAVIVIAPVTIRNIAVVHEPILISWQGGVNFYIGNNPEATGITGIPPGSNKDDWRSAYLDLKERIETEVAHPVSFSEFDRICVKKGLQFMAGQPAKAAGLLIKKTYLFFGGFEISSERDLYQVVQPTFLKYLLFKTGFLQFPYGILVPLTLAGIILGAASGSERFPLALFSALYAGSFILFFVTSRYRMGVIPFFIIFAAHGIYALVQAPPRRRMAALIAFVAAVVLFNLNAYRMTDPNQFLTEFQQAQVAYDQRDYAQALRLIERSISHNQRFAAAHNLHGLILKYRGDLDRAEKSFIRAVNTDPNLTEAYLNLGNVYAGRQDYAQAEMFYRAAIDLNPDAATAYNNLGNVYLQQQRYDEALLLYGQALRCNPQYTSPLYHKGMIYLQRGEPARAESCWTAVLRIDPNHAGARRSLEQLGSRAR